MKTLLQLIDALAPVDGLLPCPFCGKPPGVRSRLSTFSGKNIWAVSCLDETCPCKPTTAPHPMPSRDEAVAIWNTRANTALMARLRKVIASLPGILRLLDTFAAQKSRSARMDFATTNFSKPAEQAAATLRAAMEEGV